MDVPFNAHMSPTITENKAISSNTSPAGSAVTGGNDALSQHNSVNKSSSKDNSALKTTNSTSKLVKSSDSHHKHRNDKHHKHSNEQKVGKDEKLKHHHHHRNKDGVKNNKSKEENRSVKDDKKHHKDVYNSSVKPKDTHVSSMATGTKVKDNNAHPSPHKDHNASSHSTENCISPQVAKLKLKINNSNGSINSSSTSSPLKGSDTVKVKTKESPSSGSKSNLKHNSSSTDNKTSKISENDSHQKKEHKRKEHDSKHRHGDKKVKEELKPHKEKENREKGSVDVNKMSKNKDVQHKGSSEKDSQHLQTKVKNEKIENEQKPVVLPVKEDTPSEDDVPLLLVSKRVKHQSDKMARVAPKVEVKAEKKTTKIKLKKRPIESDSDEEPLSSRVSKPKKMKKTETRKRKSEDSDDEPIIKRVKKDTKPKKNTQSSQEDSPTKKKGKKEEGQDVWKWWEEEKYENGIKWKTLTHKGPVFAPEYEPLPDSIKFYYDGQTLKLSSEAEEVASFYAKMLDHDYTTKDVFNKNFFKDWRKTMTHAEKERITDLKKCNFKNMHQYFLKKSEERKAMTKEEKADLRKQNEVMTQEYGFCVIDNHKEKIGNFKIEPPGLFRGRGEHPKMGMLKKRILPENVIINCSRGDGMPKPPKGHKWKEVRHDNSVTWLACWTENVQGQTKYVMLNASSKLKGEKDWGKYEVARKLRGCVDKIREQYRLDFKSKEMKIRQRAVALYFIDKLALRAGNEKEEGETADTVGCCSLRVEHIKLHEEKNGQQYVVDFDFLGKDSVRYLNSVPVEKRVFKNLQIFMENKRGDDDLFDRLNTTVLNKHLNELMDGLTAKVFRTYNASITLQQQLQELTKASVSIPAKILSYNRANRAVAILCNHQRSVPKTFNKSMENLQIKIKAKQEQINEAEKELKKLKKSSKDKSLYERKKKAFERLEEQYNKLEVQATDKEENKDIALGTSKLNYLDPRITVAWCKKWEVPIEKVYNRTQRDKFRWAIEMAGPDFIF